MKRWQGILRYFKRRPLQYQPFNADGDSQLLFGIPVITGPVRMPAYSAQANNAGYYGPYFGTASAVYNMRYAARFCNPHYVPVSTPAQPPIQPQRFSDALSDHNKPVVH